MTELSELDQRLCDTAPARYDDLRALYINCTLKPSPARSHTQVLADRFYYGRTAGAIVTGTRTARSTVR